MIICNKKYIIINFQTIKFNNIFTVIVFFNSIEMSNNISTTTQCILMVLTAIDFYFFTHN